MKKRKGKFRKNRLKLKDGNRISLPSGQWPGTCWEVGPGQGAGVPGDEWELEPGLGKHETPGLKRELVWNGPFSSVERLAC